MNFSKQTKKNQPPTEKFYRSPGLFMQLGLVLALLIVYVSLEYTSSANTLTILEKHEPTEVDFVFTAPPTIQIDRVEEPQELPDKKVAQTDPEIVPDDTPDKEIFELTKKDDTTPDNATTDEKIEGIIEVITEEDKEPVPFIALEEAPIFPGCEGLKGEESKTCFTKQMSKFVNRKFDSSIAEELNLTGKHRIITFFTIDQHGMVTDIQIRAPHKRLEKEALRVIEKLPEMIPGKQRKKAVPVKYTLPIVFQVK